MIGRDVRKLAGDEGLPILKTEIEQRVAFAESMTMGQTIFEWAGGSAAAREIKRLTKEILSYEQESVRSSSKAKAANG